MKACTNNVSRYQNSPYSHKNEKINNKKCECKKDVYKDTPVRYLGYTNELGAAFGEVCKNATGIARHIPMLSNIPALLYVGLDVFDKYKKGEDGTGEKPSIKVGAKELVNQLITNIIAPTAIIKGVQKLTKFTASKLSRFVPENIVNTLTKNNNRWGKIATVVISLAALAIVSKPLDKVTEKASDKFLNPILGIKHTENDSFEPAEKNKDISTKTDDINANEISDFDKDLDIDDNEK